MTQTIVLLILSNIFMTYAWYGHLHHLGTKPLWVAIALSWGIAFFEYCLQVPANRIGFQYFTLPQLKIIQEVISLTVFVVYAVLVTGQAFTKNYLYAAICLSAAVFFIFRGE